MKVTVAPDSLKESLTASEAARAIARGLRKASSQVEPVLVPMGDGGEGTTEAMVEATGGSYHKARVSDPLGRPITATWGVCGDGKTTIVEMAQASGLELLQPNERNPMLTSTRGTGELIRAALDFGAERIIIGIGGSATVDGGTGMAEALGVRFFDARGGPVTNCCGGRLGRICDIDAEGLDPRVKDVEIVVASDVANPLTGPDGAARTYGPQKGATGEQTEELERALCALAEAIRTKLGVEIADLPGAGAAGGLGAGLVAFLGARLRSGVETVMEAVQLREKMAGSELVVTAEGRIDWQSAFGKTVLGVASAAREQGIPTVVLAGSLGPGHERIYAAGVAGVFPIVDGPMTLQDALERADVLLEKAAESVMRLWLAAGGRPRG
ncbi:MAG: glycerate kinase [Candidatus Brocadiae bacterium]|nr:glycerate kinase [Candidatus Brocadiia bacterium]